MTQEDLGTVAAAVAVVVAAVVVVGLIETVVMTIVDQGDTEVGEAFKVEEASEEVMAVVIDNNRISMGVVEVMATEDKVVVAVTTTEISAAQGVEIIGISSSRGREVMVPVAMVSSRHMVTSTNHSSSSSSSSMELMVTRLAMVATRATGSRATRCHRSKTTCSRLMGHSSLSNSSSSTLTTTRVTQVVVTRLESRCKRLDFLFCFSKQICCIHRSLTFMC